MCAVKRETAHETLKRGWHAVSTLRPAPKIPDLSALPLFRLRTMLAAGREVQECGRVLKKGGLNLVGEVLREQGEFIEYSHYPADDVFDEDSRSQYYYHAHRGLEGEHGHFHTFIRRPGSLIGAVPLDFSASEPWPAGDDEIAHLIAISMDAYGWPIGLFAANRWVTGDTWFRARDVIRMLDYFRVDHAFPSWPVNRWISAMLVLFRPHIEALLVHRDEVIKTWIATHPREDIFENRELEVTGFLSISVDTIVEELQAATRDNIVRRKTHGGRT